MSETPNPNVENNFLSRARYPKGKKRLRAILDSTYEIVISEGLAAASQEAIAKRAKVTQSAVRHYFPTKDELLLAFFSTGIERLDQLLRSKMAEVDRDPRELLIESAALHYDRMLEVEDVYFFEAAAFWGRNPEFCALRDAWYQSLERHYVGLIRQIHPAWGRPRCVAVSVQVLTLVLGGWVTLGSSRPLYRNRSRASIRSMLLQGIEELVG